MEPSGRHHNRPMTLMSKARSLTAFDVGLLTAVIYGDADTVRQRQQAWARVEAEMGVTDTWKLPSQYARTSREDLYLDGLRLGKATWKDRAEHKHDFFDWLTPRYTLANYSPFGLTIAMFAKMVELMATPEQREKWLVPTLQGSINGAFVQTELGHGSFVRGLETTATFDPDRDCFILNSPTVTSTKFWPGSLAFSASHGIVMARLITRGRDYGVHSFMVQLRDIETGRPTPGIELGDVGPKPSHNQNDNGYARFDHVAIPRGNMLMGQAQVSRDGSYNRAAQTHPKANYATMMYVRANMVRVCAIQLAAAVTIAARYSITREQGLSHYDDGGGSTSGGEIPVIQYRSQHYRLMTALAKAYAILFASRRCTAVHRDFEKRQARGDFSTMGAAHALTAGMKAWASAIAAEAAEDARKCCGGAGYLAISGLPELVYSLTALCTLEGENYVLWQQTARYLMKMASRITQDTTQDDLKHVASPYIDRCPATGRQFLNPDTQLLIFQHRAQRLLRESARSLGASSAEKKTIAEAWNYHMMLLISTAQAHIEYLSLQEFIAATTDIVDTAVKRVLSSLCSLFALSHITSPLSPGSHTFIEDGFLSLTQLVDIRTLVNELLDDLLPQLCGLTDAWDFTDAGLGSAIGMKDGNVYERLLSWTRQLPINQQATGDDGVHQGWGRFMKPALGSKL